MSSRNTHSIKRYDFATGNYLGDLVAPGSGGLSFPQEVLPHPDGFLLVTGRGQTAVKKYDSGTGAYLGNFTSGYALDNPTKTTIGPDGRLYVSQWGTQQNKIIRFGLASGTFLDEFTSIGVVNGTGHAWNEAGHLFVAQYGNGANGRILEFDTDGTFLQTFVPNGPVRGPVNLWFDGTGDLFVVDWTLGDVLRFDGATGALEAVIVNTASNLEGFAIGPDGDLFFGDWSGNQVLRFDIEGGDLTPYLTTGGLLAPNSLLLRDPETSGLGSGPGAGSDARPPEAPLRLQASPNPGREDILLEYSLPSAGHVRLEVRDLTGRRIATLRDEWSNAGDQRNVWNSRGGPEGDLPRGVYFFILRSASGLTTTKFVVR